MIGYFASTLHKLQITYLEETDVHDALQILVDMERMEDLDLVCKGGVALYSDHHYHFETLGYHCCSREMPCKHGEGDCNRNDECLPGNLCREGSCTDSLGFSGGFWDASDSCCEQRCTAEHLCSEGWVLNQTHLCLGRKKICPFSKRAFTF